MKLIVEKVENGFIISQKDDELGLIKTIFEENPARCIGHNHDDLEMLQSMLYSIMDFVGYIPSKHSPFKLMVKIVPGDHSMFDGECEFDPKSSQYVQLKFDQD